MNAGRRSVPRPRGRGALASLALLVLIGVCGLFGPTSSTADAATAYRYWAYYVAGSHGWQFSQRGPASEYPVDGEVQGWRYAIQADVGSGSLPRAAPDFTSLCHTTAAISGQLRVGIVLDFGVASDAPAGEHPPATVVTGCVHVADGASGFDVLRAAAGSGGVRVGTGADGGLICGIGGYPKTECASSVKVPTPTPAAPTAAPATTAATRTSAPSPPSPPTPSSKNTGPAPTATPALGSQPDSGVPSVSVSSDPASPTASAVAAISSAQSLAELRQNDRGKQSVPVAAFVGAALVVALGAAGVWRAKAARR